MTHTETEWKDKMECFEVVHKYFSDYAREYGRDMAVKKYTKSNIVCFLDNDWSFISQMDFIRLVMHGYTVPKGKSVYKVKFNNKGTFTLNFID